MNDKPSDVAHRFAAAFNARDTGEILACFTPDAVYHDLFYGRFSQQAGLQRLFERMFSEGSRHVWTMTRVVEYPECTMGEWNFAFTVSDAVPQSSGRTLRFDGVSVFETRHGLCHTYREHFDRGAALFALGIRPSTVAGLIARRPSVEVTAASGPVGPPT